MYLQEPTYGEALIGVASELQDVPYRGEGRTLISPLELASQMGLVPKAGAQQQARRKDPRTDKAERGVDRLDTTRIKPGDIVRMVYWRGGRLGQRRTSIVHYLGESIVGMNPLDRKVGMQEF